MPVWAPGLIFTGLNSLIAVVFAYAYLKYKVDDLTKSDSVVKSQQENANNKLEIAIKETIKEFHASIQDDRRTLVEIATLVKVTTAEQSVINKFTTGLLNSLADKVDKLQKDYNDLAQTIILIRAVLDKEAKK